MMLRWRYVIMLFAVVLVFPAPAAATGDPVAREIGAIISGAVPVRHDLSPAHMDAARRLYALRQNAPLWWTGRDWQNSARLAQQALAHAGQEGLRAADYAVGARQLPAKDASPLQIATADALLTAALLRYISDIANGRLRPHEIDPELYVTPDIIDPYTVLRAGMEAADFAGWLHALAPSTPGYSQLRDALAQMRIRAGAGNWPLLPDGPKLEKGQRADTVRTLRRQLVLLGDLSPGLFGDDQFDAALETAVKIFQSRHGLDADGVVGRATRRALNAGPAERAKQIILNMERLRWLDDNFGPRYVLVNIASFELIAVDDSKIVIRSPVVVGRAYRRTPVLSDQIVNLVLSPTWTPPPRLAKLDILPRIRADPAYLRQQGFRVFDGWGADARELDPAAINWRSVTPNNLRFRFRQEPGPLNALGGVRFSLTNAFGIYLHDTPHKELFAKHQRGFSSGCIRVAKVVELALFALENAPDWPPGRLAQAMTSVKPEIVKLARPLPIHIIYRTAWVDDGGRLQFRNDIYGRDTLFRSALKLDVPE